MASKFLFEKVTNLRQRGEFVSYKHFRKIIPFESDLFRSYYGYDSRIVEFLQNGGKIEEFEGPWSLPEVVLDFDGHNDNLGETLLKVQETVLSLQHAKDVPEWNIMTWFSGGGFHLCLPAGLFGEKFKPSKILPRIVRNTMMDLFPDADNIYDSARLIRVGHTRNTKREKWKIPVPIELVHKANINEILEIAQQPYSNFNGYTSDVDHPVLQGYVIETVEALPQKERVGLPDRDLTNIVTCMHSLYLRGPVSGRRHTDLLRLVSHWRRQHMPFEVCLDMARTWLSQGNGEPFKDNELERLVRDVFDKDYRYGCNDEVRLEFCHNKCIFYAQKNEGGEILSTDDMHQNFMDLASSKNFTNPVNLGKMYNLGGEFNIYPSEMLSIVGDTGVNKTAFAQLLSIFVKPRRVVYVSTEMGKGLLYRRFVQQCSGMGKEEVLAYYQKGQQPPGLKYMDHIRMTDSAPTVQKIYKYLLDIKPEVLVVDVIEDIGDDPDPNKRIDQAAVGLNGMAKQLGIIVIVISHVRKGASGMPLDLDSSKGPKSLMQKSDKVIAIEGTANDPAMKRKLRSLKARDESPFNIKLVFNPLNFKLEQTHGTDNDE